MAEPMSPNGTPGYGTGLNPANGGMPGNGAARPADMMPPNAHQQPQQQVQQAPPKKKKSMEDMHLDELCELIVAEKGTDLHITAGIPPIIRVDGELLPTDYENCSPRDTQTDDVLDPDGRADPAV